MLTTQSELRAAPQPAALRAWTGLLREHAASTRLLSASLQADHGLSINDYEALLLLHGAGAPGESCAPRGRCRTRVRAWWGAARPKRVGSSCAERASTSRSS